MCACIYVCVQVRIHVCSHKGQQIVSDIFPQKFATCSFEVGPLSSLLLTKQSKSTKSLRNLPVLTFPKLGLQVYITTPTFLPWFGELSLGHYACKVSILPTEPTP